MEIVQISGRNHSSYFPGANTLSAYALDDTGIQEYVP